MNSSGGQRDRRSGDGSAGDADYGHIGIVYSRYRQPDPLIAARVHAALGDARSVLNVGAGSGSYEPRDRRVVAVEPSATMRAQRPAELPEAVDAVAEHLPFRDDSFDAGMVTFSVHQWRDLRAGLAELRRVTRGPVVILTCDPERVPAFWLNQYAPQVIAIEAARYPAIRELSAGLNGTCQADLVPIPLECADGFNEAYYGRPEMLLDSRARLSCSAWSFLDRATEARYVQHLAEDLSSGAWDARLGVLRTQPWYQGSLVLVTSTP